MISTSLVYEQTKNLSVLFVEDDIEFLMQTQNLLQNLFKSVSTAQNGQLGLEKFKDKLKKSNHAYDIIITDISMPVMNGIEMIEEIQKIIPNQPIVVTSAHNDAHYLISLLNLEISCFIIKPLEIESVNKSLYKISKEINNEFLIQKHYLEIEKLNKELSEQSNLLKKTNDELKDKNIALEKSMRIIEGLHHKDQMHKNNNIDINHKTQVISNANNHTNNEEKTISQKKECLKNIEYLICNISLKYQQNDTENEYFKQLSNEIIIYINSLPNKKMYIKLKESLKQLSQTVWEPPACTNEKELTRVFTIFESFFYIYTKWQEEWPNIDENNFELFSSTMENEINTLVNIWKCNI